jgi:hypothetical protein
VDLLRAAIDIESSFSVVCSSKQGPRPCAGFFLGRGSSFTAVGGNSFPKAASGLTKGRQSKTRNRKGHPKSSIDFLSKGGRFQKIPVLFS